MPKHQKFVLNRDLTQDECHWLYETVPAGTVVYEFKQPTYGCIGSGAAVTYDESGGYPFFEVPWNALVVAG